MPSARNPTGSEFKWYGLFVLVLRSITVLILIQDRIRRFEFPRTLGDSTHPTVKDSIGE